MYRSLYILFVTILACLMNAIVNFIDTRTSEPYNTSATTNPEFLGIQFFISSPDCQYNFATSFATSTDPVLLLLIPLSYNLDF